MQFKLLSTLALATFAMAAPGGTPAPTSPCSAETGSLHCCNSLQESSNASVGLLASLLGIVLGPLTGQVGLTCSPLSIIGISGNSCSSQAACCTGNTFSGLITVGCTPININV